MDLSLKPQWIFLTGFMGCGKTTLGEKLASMTQLPFYDTDILVESYAGRPVKEIFQLEGEKIFREMEKLVLRSLVNTQAPGIVATGGGLVLDPANRKLMREYGTVIWLDRSPTTLLIDLERNPEDRPLLTREHWQDWAVKTYRDRIPYYLQCHIKIHNGKDTEQTLQLVIQRINSINS